MYTVLTLSLFRQIFAGTIKKFGKQYLYAKWKSNIELEAGARDTMFDLLFVVHIMLYSQLTARSERIRYISCHK